ncbi:hypothetical protein CesoFtcFv8_002867 [Champsocephalus esox]|uniref:Uncharacterized protein n=1 Tax=Champsocephalus esox TaxID=159716 RepID=A0AAN8CYN9_9TELE|nr:hypothetical protein CesoFtcFv8_002867 [Champsocephalus esox]
MLFAEHVRLYSYNNTFNGSMCTLLWCSTSDIGRPAACVQREPNINSEGGETTPSVGRPLLLGLLLSHSNARSRKLV